MSASKPFSTGFTPFPPDGPRPGWLKIRVSCGGEMAATRSRLRSLGLDTVCASAACPNICHCWSRGHATILILGPECTRHCRFCNVSKGVPAPPDPDEPKRVAEAVRDSELGEVVVTSVTRDDLPDGGATHWAATINAIRVAAPGVRIEVLTPDFQGDANAKRSIFDRVKEIFV